MHLVQSGVLLVQHNKYFKDSTKTLLYLNDFLHLLHIDIVFLKHWLKNILPILFVPFKFFTWLLQI